MTSLKVALIGYGLGGKVFHAPLIESIPEFNLCAIVSSRREQIADDFPNRLMGDSTADADLVVISTPDETHVPLARAALEAGKHVVVDKPFTLSLADARSPEGVSYIVARLLGPGGCPWDREQTHLSIRQDLLEETYEALEALDAGDMDALAEELGDVLLHVLMHSEMARQAGEFDIGDVYEHIATKLIRRHPHVFGEVAVAGSGEVVKNWDAIKREERASKQQAPRASLDGVPPGMPALMTAQATIRKAAKAGFDSDDQDWPWNKLREEIDELYAAAHTESHADAAARTARIEEEFGDMLLAVSKLGNRLKLDAESALRVATAKFRRRFAAVERQLREQGRALLTSSLAEKEALWQQAKDE